MIEGVTAASAKSQGYVDAAFPWGFTVLSLDEGWGLGWRASFWCGVGVDG